MNIRITMHDPKTQKPFVVDGTGLLVSFLTIFAFFPSVAFSGFNLMTWTIVAIFVLVWCTS